MKSHEVDYEIIGDDMQIVEVELDPNETVIAEAGAMNYMEAGIGFESRMGDGTNPKAGVMDTLLSVGKRALTGESIFLTHFTHRGPGKKRVAFAAPYPGKILAMDLDDVGGELLCQKDAFLAAARGTEVSLAFNKRLGAGFFGGEGFILQKLRGDGMCFIHIGDTVVEKQLKGETLRVDTGCLAAFTSGIGDNQGVGDRRSEAGGQRQRILHGRVRRSRSDYQGSRSSKARDSSCSKATTLRCKRESCWSHPQERLTAEDVSIMLTCSCLHGSCQRRAGPSAVQSATRIVNLTEPWRILGPLGRERQAT